MRPTLSATHTYNFALAKWLGKKLKPLSLVQYTVTDTFEFRNEIRDLKINTGESWCRMMSPRYSPMYP